MSRRKVTPEQMRQAGGMFAQLAGELAKAKLEDYIEASAAELACAWCEGEPSHQCLGCGELMCRGHMSQHHTQCDSRTLESL